MNDGRTSHVGRWRTRITTLAAIVAATICIDIPFAYAQGQSGTIAGVLYATLPAPCCPA